ncbi:type-2 ice-structuring protein-like [Centropristis striata]|uniref:type-2 ice-structuring protein-like n=1 Tax=Centropristis striata TaxID=184440 RepID=UPI0027E1C73A|nr:type-2 ice-structuring protein-like [Centropristis striata]
MLTVSLLVCAVIVLAGADDAPAAPSCPDGFQEFNGRCFHYVDTERSWTDAEKNCQSMEGNLASVHSELDYRFIQMMMEKHTNGSLPNSWIGGTDCQKEGSWFWSDGSTFLFQLWCPREPNNIHGNQHCMEMNFGADNCWNDMDCAKKHPSVCARSL